MSFENQEIGDIGESRSEVLCTLSSYIPNKAQKDRMGWDYHIQDRRFSDAMSPWDKRSLGHTCYLQIKTKNASTGPGFKVRLPAAERLAKSLYPAFIVVYTVHDDTRETVSISVIHIKGSVLDRILQRLRRANKEEEDISEISLAFNINQGALISESLNTLRQVIESECGSSPDLYISKKRTWLNRSGYSELPWDVKLSLDLSDGTDFHEAVVMGKPIRLAADVSVIENRYGIGMPIQPYPGILKKGSEIYIENEPDSIGRIQFSSNGVVPFYMPAKLVSVPLDEGLNMHKVAIRSEIADIMFDVRDGDSRATATFIHGEEKRSSTKLNVADWIKYFTCMLNMTSKGGSVSYIPEGSLSGEFSLKVEQGFFHPSNSKDYLKIVRVIRKFSYLMDISGVDVGKVSYKDITKSAHLCAVAYHRIKGHLQINVGGFANIGDAETVTMIVFGYFNLCDMHFAYKIPIVFNKGSDPDLIWSESSYGEPYIKQISGDQDSQREFFYASHDGVEYTYKRHLDIRDEDYINSLYDTDA